MWNCRGKRQRQIRGIAASRLAGSRSRTRCPVVDLQLPWSTCNACCPPLATHLESQGPSPSPAPVTQDSSSVQQSPDTSQRSATEKLVSFCGLQAAGTCSAICRRLKAVAAAAAAGAAAMKTRRCSCTRDWAAARRSLLVAVLAMIRRWP
jgi:hypothetical protein